MAQMQLQPDARAIAAGLTNRCRALMLKMKPHNHSQVMSAKDYAEVDPFIEDNEGKIIWLGGMRKTWVMQREINRFQFNDLGLAVRAILQGQAQ